MRKQQSEGFQGSPLPFPLCGNNETHTACIVEKPGWTGDACFNSALLQFPECVRRAKRKSPNIPQLVAYHSSSQLSLSIKHTDIEVLINPFKLSPSCDRGLKAMETAAMSHIFSTVYSNKNKASHTVSQQLGCKGGKSRDNY